MGFSRQEYRSGLPFPSPVYLPNIGSEPRSPSLQADSLPSESPGIQTHYDLNKRSLFSLVQSLSHVQFFATPWTAAHQASLPITNFWSLLKLMSNESVMPSSHLILCRPFFLPPSIFPSIRVFSNESVVRIKLPKYWSSSFKISPSDEYSGLIPLGWTGWISFQSKGLSRVFSSSTVQKHQFFNTQLSL